MNKSRQDCRSEPKFGSCREGIELPETSERRMAVVLLLVALVAGLWFTAGMLAEDGAPYLSDFVAYWGVGRLLLEGRNPYDVQMLHELQLPLGLENREAAVVRYPPWSLSILVPFAAMQYARGWYVWTIGQILLVGGASAVLWKMYGGRARPAIAVAITFGFPPVLFLALGGQIAGLLLVGLTGFTWAVIHRKDYMAGLFLFLLTLKPHVLLPFGIAVLVWMITERRFRPILGVFTGVLIGTLVAISLQPDIFHQYLEFARAEVPEEDVVATLGAALRLFVGFEHFWVQWIPAVLGVVWALLYSISRRENWDWLEQLPLLAAVSWVSAPYGWVHDMTLLVPTVIDGAVRLEESADRRKRRFAVSAFVIFAVAVWAQHLRFGPGVAHAWLGPVVLLTWLWVRASFAGPNIRARPPTGGSQTPTEGES